LVLGPRRPLSRQTAWGCLTTNLALPGFGSLVAGRVSGYAQAALALGGEALTLAYGARCMVWFGRNWARLQAPDADFFAVFWDIWVAGGFRWAALGIALFALGWLWALATSLSLLDAAKTNDSPGTPPRLQ
jgi:hypothetical protein